ncbi:MAG: PAS domain S-box protein [Caulobacteraceae bacterium]|nr:ATP-binding protein [Caulobacter sp.]RYF94498.1 MAG: PAS domain S-box protein [Caulobacteraceae bacterium]
MLAGLFQKRRADSRVAPVQVTGDQLAASMHHSSIGTALVGLDGGWLRINPAFCALLGYEAEELRGKSFQDVTHPADLAADQAKVDALIASGDAGYHMEKRYIRKDGSQVWVLLTVTVARTPDGAPAYFISQVQDITERKRNELALQALTQRVTVATRAAGIGIWEWDAEHDSLIWDDRTFELHFRTPKAKPVNFAYLVRCIHSDDRRRVVTLLHQAYNARGAFDAEFRTTGPGGKVRVVHAQGQFVAVGEDGALRMLGAIWDVTDTRRLMEEARSASEAKSQFLATMSHEIRTPLNGVLGMAQAMAHDPLPPAQRERLTVIQDSGEALLGILNDILDLTKIESGMLVLEEVEFGLGKLLRGVHRTFAGIAQEKDLAFLLDIDRAEGRYIGDPTRVRQVVSNFVSNALKFTSKGMVSIEALRDGGKVVLRVVDSGVGMAGETTEHIFERFTQADSSTTRTHGGSGLGLSICRELVSRMGGVIRVESMPGVGSTFSVTLPLKRVGDEVEAAPAQAEDRSGGETMASLRVLVAEDNLTNQTVLSALLGQFEVTPHFVGNGREAVAAWRAQPWDLILMDVQMPVMDGICATREIRAAESLSSAGKTPIIALTANVMPCHLEEYEAAGMNAVVAKPIELRSLVSAIERLV